MDGAARIQRCGGEDKSSVRCLWEPAPTPKAAIHRRHESGRAARPDGQSGTTNLRPCDHGRHARRHRPRPLAAKHPRSRLAGRSRPGYTGPMHTVTFTLYREYLETTGDPSAAASLTLADTLQNSMDAAQEPKTTPPAGSILNLKQAAAYLGYAPAGLREIVGRTRRKQAGGHALRPNHRVFSGGKTRHAAVSAGMARPFYRGEPCPAE